MKMKVALAVSSLALHSAAAYAAPAYLLCQFGEGDQAFPVEITADEAAGTVSLYMPTTGNREQLTGTFSAEKVIFADRQMTYALSRVEPLVIVRVVPLIHSSERGRCEVKTTPKRAF